VLLKCVNQFGNFMPGDEVEVPDGNVFDTAYFREIEKPKVKEEKTDGS
jgi:hypothetical protein